MGTAWAWVRSHWRYLLILPAILAVWPWLRRARSPSPAPGPGPGGPTGPEAERVREEIRDTAARDEAEIRARAEADRERLRKVLGRIVR
jgi:hypothetical protein